MGESPAKEVENLFPDFDSLFENDETATPDDDVICLGHTCRCPKCMVDEWYVCEGDIEIPDPRPGKQRATAEPGRQFLWISISLKKQR